MAAAKKKKAAKKTAKKVTSKKKVVKKAAKKVTKKTVKKTAKKKVAKKAASTKVTVGKKAFTKSETLSAIADHSELSKKEVSAVLEGLSKVIEAHAKKGVPFSVPGLMKIKVVKKPATKARKGINPFTGEPTVFKAKPASKKVKVLPLKALKDMV